MSVLAAYATIDFTDEAFKVPPPPSPREGEASSAPPTPQRNSVPQRTLPPPPGGEIQQYKRRLLDTELAKPAFARPSSLDELAPAPQEVPEVRQDMFAVPDAPENVRLEKQPNGVEAVKAGTLLKLVERLTFKGHPGAFSLCGGEEGPKPVCAQILSTCSRFF